MVSVCCITSKLPMFSNLVTHSWPWPAHSRNSAFMTPKHHAQLSHIPSVGDLALSKTAFEWASDAPSTDSGKIVVKSHTVRPNNFRWKPNLCVVAPLDGQVQASSRSLGCRAFSSGHKKFHFPSSIPQKKHIQLHSPKPFLRR